MELGRAKNQRQGRVTAAPTGWERQDPELASSQQGAQAPGSSLAISLDCPSARSLDTLQASKNDPLGPRVGARCALALTQRSRVGSAAYRFLAGLEAPALVAGFENVAMVGRSKARIELWLHADSHAASRAIAPKVDEDPSPG